MKLWSRSYKYSAVPTVKQLKDTQHYRQVTADYLFELPDSSKDYYAIIKTSTSGIIGQRIQQKVVELTYNAKNKEKHAHYWADSGTFIEDKIPLSTSIHMSSLPFDPIIYRTPGGTLNPEYDLNLAKTKPLFSDIELRKEISSKPPRTFTHECDFYETVDDALGGSKRKTKRRRKRSKKSRARRK